MDNPQEQPKYKIQGNPMVYYDEPNKMFQVTQAMPLGDYFAGQVLNKIFPGGSPAYGPVETSRLAYEYADAMLRVRKE